MEAARHFGSEIESAAIADTDREKPAPSSNERGFFVIDGGGQGEDTYSPLPYDLEIADWSELKPKFVRGAGDLKTSIVRLEDGSVYVLRNFEPLHQKWDTRTEFEPPLATLVDGFNTYIGIQLAKAGIPASVVGTNQSQGFTLLHDAQASLHILNEDDQRQQAAQSQIVRPGQTAKLGYSMGEMKQLMQRGLAARMGRKIIFSIGLDPCLAEEVDYAAELEDPQRALGLALYLGREAIEIPRIIASNLLEERNPIKTLRRWGHLASTFGITPAYLRNAKDKWDVIATGETGRYLGDIPQDAVGIIHVFDRSHFNNDPIYEEALAKHPNFRLLHEDGLHLSGGDPRVIGRVVSHTKLGLELVGQGASPSELADALYRPVLAG